MDLTQRGSILTAADGANTDKFGTSVALSATGDVLVVGANTWDSIFFTDSGGVYIYDRSGSTWTQRGSVLTPSDAAMNDYFGASVAVSGTGDVLAVGAPQWESSGGASDNPGGVYIYDRNVSSWTKRGSTLVPGDAAASNNFGLAVALSGSGDVLAVGATHLTTNGAVYVYDRSGSTWIQRGAILTGASSTTFGSSVAFSADGTVLVVGDYLNGASGASAGGVYTYDRSGSTWVQRGTVLFPGDIVFGDDFGWSVALSGDGAILLVGAKRWEGTNSNQGGVYVYTRSGSTWVLDGSVATAASGAANDEFGSGVAIDDAASVVVVGAAVAASGFGGVYTYDTLDMLNAALNESASIVSGVNHTTFTLYLDTTGLTSVLSSSSNTTSTVVDAVVVSNIIQQAINQIVADTAAGADALNLDAAVTLVDVAVVGQTQTSTQTSVMLVAELIASIEALNSVASEDTADTVTAADAYTRRVDALVALIESAIVTHTDSGVIHVMASATDTATSAVSVTSTGSILNALLSDAALVTIRLNVGGELFTGWVLNTDTLAPSEYQFADRQFNSACKHGDKYLMAAEDGIYEFTEDVGVESVMTYIKTGKSDFGSDLKKRIVNSYIVYSATGNMVLKVTTSEYGQLQTRNYRLVPPRNSETTDVRRVDIGRGIKSRYWQFELVGDGVDCDIDEIGMLPIVLSRRI